MSKKTTAGLQRSGTTDESSDGTRIDGPIPAVDTYGTPRSDDYDCCPQCGVEAMHRRDRQEGRCTCPSEGA